MMPYQEQEVKKLAEEIASSKANSVGICLVMLMVVVFLSFWGTLSKISNLTDRVIELEKSANSVQVEVAK